MQLTRSNDDPKLLGDLARLADRPGSPVEQIAAIEDPFVRRFVQTVTHVKRYLPFYAGGALWLLAILLIQPVGDGRGGADQTSSADYASANTSFSSSSSAAPASPEAVPAAPVDAYGLSVFTPPEAPAAEAAPPPQETSFPESFGPEAGPPVDDGGGGGGALEPNPLTIVASGYSSASGGTPLEQSPPRGGLPVASIAGNDARRSFIRLAGTETVLRLKAMSDQGATIHAEGAGIKACPITTADWTPARGQKLDAGPAYSTGLCSTGTQGADGVWTFDLGYFGPVSDGNGFALVPAAGTLPSFQVTFEPAAVPA